MAGSERQWSRAEVGGRCARHDAAIIIDNVVYDVTQFLDDHPGGAEILLDAAGGDASQCFHDVGHSEDARDWMRRYRVGEVVAGERREVVRARSTAAGPREPLSPAGLARVAGPPLAFAALAATLYLYLFA